MLSPVAILPTVLWLFISIVHSPCLRVRRSTSMRLRRRDTGIAPRPHLASSDPSRILAPSTNPSQLTNAQLRDSRVTCTLDIADAVPTGTSSRVPSGLPSVIGQPRRTTRHHFHTHPDCNHDRLAAQNYKIAPRSNRRCRSQVPRKVVSFVFFPFTSLNHRKVVIRATT